MNKIWGSIISISLFFLLATQAQAAGLLISPQSGNYSQGSIITVQVLVNSTEQAMNAATGLITFPTDLLEVSSISKSGSLYSFWAQEPIFSNTQGTISFEGIVLTPGFTGSSGKLLTINFRSKQTGSASVSFSSGVVLANDGLSTNITKSLGSAQFTITPKTKTPPIEDKTPPSDEQSLELKEITRDDLTNPKIKLSIKTIGFSTKKYEITASSLPDIKWSEGTNGTYTSDPLPPGKHPVIVNAYDEDNQKFSQSIEVVVNPLESPLLFPPSNEIVAPHVVVIRGKALPNIDVKLFGKTPQSTSFQTLVKSDSSGNFLGVITESSLRGNYTVQAIAIDERGSQSLPSETVTITVEGGSIFNARNNLIIILILIILVIVLLLLLKYLTHRQDSLGKKKKGTSDRSNSMNIKEAFELLREDLRKHLRALQNLGHKKSLKEKEIDIIVAIERELRQADALVQKELGD